MFPNATWSSHGGKSIIVAVNPISYFLLILATEFCALLALDTDHLRIPAIHEDMQRYLNL